MDSERGRYSQVKEKTNHPFVAIGLLIFLAFDVIMLIVGCEKKDDCPVEPRIPLYLIVAGAAGILSKGLPLINRKLDWCLIDLVASVLYLFEFVWTILGSVWVYSIYKPNYDDSEWPYCSKTAYLLGFWLLTIHWVLLALSIVLACCCCCCPKFK